MRQLFVNNNFPIGVIDKTIDDFKASHNHAKFLTSDLASLDSEQDAEDRDDKITLYYQSQMSSYYKTEESKIKDIVKKRIKPGDAKSKISLIIYYKGKKLKNLIIKNKIHLANSIGEESHVVYQYTCNQSQCNLANPKKYIGYTTTTLKERMLQHKSIKNHHKIHHNRKIGYKEMLEHTNVVSRKSSRQDLLIMEALSIKNFKPELNNKEEGCVRILRIF